MEDKKVIDLQRANLAQKLEKYKTQVLHKDPFHADDVFSRAWFEYIYKSLALEVPNLKRTFEITDEMKNDPEMIICDIGLGPYDHHQKEELKQRRPNGTAYAAFGLLVRDFHEGILTEDEYQYFDKNLVEPLDDHDNNGTFNCLSYAISIMNKNWNETGTNDNDEYFHNAVDMAYDIIYRWIMRIKAMSACESLVEVLKPEYKTVWLEKWAPIADYYINNPDVEFMGYPDNRGVYAVMSIRNSEGRNKHLFPESFRGFSNAKEPNEYGMTFCHASGFIASFVNMDVAKHFMKNYKF